MRFRVVEREANKYKPYHAHLKYEVQQWFSSGSIGWQGTKMFFETKRQAEIWINSRLYPIKDDWNIDTTIYIA